MAKLPAIWSAQDGNSSYSAVSGHILLETGGILLLENGNYYALEDVTITRKETSLWDAPANKSNSAWIGGRGDSSTVTQANALVKRTQQDTTTRTLQDGTVRILQESLITPKSSSSWHE